MSLSRATIGISSATCTDTNSHQGPVRGDPSDESPCREICGHDGDHKDDEPDRPRFGTARGISSRWGHLVAASHRPTRASGSSLAKSDRTAAPIATALEHGWALVTKDRRLRDHRHPRRITVW